MDEILPNRSNEITIKGNDYFETVAQEDGSILVRPKWISVKDVLPQQGERVLAYAIEDENLSYLDCHYFEADQHEGIWTENVDSCVIHVTHWMPLPKPPAEK